MMKNKHHYSQKRKQYCSVQLKISNINLKNENSTYCTVQFTISSRNFSLQFMFGQMTISITTPLCMLHHRLTHCCQCFWCY
ncbi:hypothetical protein C0J52_08314 [Blattella germanica]|nr:hypothetical protein C0J52_08314 [Blattella germanica]